MEEPVIDCDVHINPPGLGALLPYMDRHWRDHLGVRGIGGFETSNDLLGSPAATRPDWRRPGEVPASSLDALRRDILDPWDTQIAIANCLYGGPLVLDSYMSAAVCSATNDWIAWEWLDREPRLRASIVVSLREPELAAAEIERVAADGRFVQVLLLTSAEMLYGRRHYWPIYAAAERHGLPVALHAGSAFRTPLTASGWPTYYVEQYASHAATVQNQITSLICEGVFSRFPALRFVLLETGFSWIPAYLWRLTKIWKAARIETPWVDRDPAELFRERVRVTTQPLDQPPVEADAAKLLGQLGSDGLLLFATDYPHWHFDSPEEALPKAMTAEQRRRLLAGNARETYARLGAAA